MKRSKIAIIGGGSSGLFAATLLNDCNADVFLFEKNNKLGKKILASGNGKCNFTNILDLNNKYNNVFANKTIEKFTVEDTLNKFSEYGLVYKNDNQGRCYPVSECSSSVLDVLKRKMNNINILLDTQVKNITLCDNGYLVEYGDKKELFEYVVCSSGSVASNLGSDKAYSYFKNINVCIGDLKPSLVPMIVKENISSLQGVRVKCILKLFNENGKQYSEEGEVLFKNDSLSGIAVFNASSIMNRSKGKYKIVLDLSSGMSKKQLFEYINSKKEFKHNLFKGLFNDKISNYILEISGYKGENINEEMVNKLIANVQNLSFDIMGVYPMREGQVCSGGVLLTEVNDNLELKKYANMYVSGELLDIDGISGGYNMQFAWSSAAVIANDIKKKIGV